MAARPRSQSTAVRTISPRSSCFARTKWLKWMQSAGGCRRRCRNPGHRSRRGPAAATYELEKYLPGFTIVAILGWDDFLVRNHAGELFQVPTVPLVQKYMERARLPDASSLEPDERFTGKIKWYVKPIVFGGDPSSDDNIFWVDLPQHQELVCWWNKMHRDVAGR